MRFHKVTMNKTMVFGVSIMAVFAIGTISMVPVALAYSGLGAEGGITLEEHLELATRKVKRLTQTQQQVQELLILMLVVYVALL